MWRGVEGVGVEKMGNQNKMLTGQWPLRPGQRGMVCWGLQTRPPLLSPGPSLYSLTTASLQPHCLTGHRDTERLWRTEVATLASSGYPSHSNTWLSCVLSPSPVLSTQTLFRPSQGVLIKAAATPCYNKHFEPVLVCCGFFLTVR